MDGSVHIELSRSAYRRNLDFIRELLHPGVQFSSVVKGNAYGHGIRHIVPMAEAEGVDHFSVFNGEEALQVHEVSQRPSTILVMGMLTDEQLAWAIKHGVEFFVFDPHRLDRADALARSMNTEALVHVELETGMNRTGFPPRALPTVVDQIERSPNLRFRGLCTHFAGAESIANYYRVQKQRKAFQRAVRRLAARAFEPEIYHTACSAASMRYPKTQMDLVRIGILQYGFFPSREVLIDHLTKRKLHEEPLHRIISWKSRVMSLKLVRKGEFVGYGTSFFANQDLRIATVPVGYAHGFGRSLSNQGRVLIRGQFAPVVGIVNMNMCSVDVTSIDGVEQGDEVVLIGRQGDHEISVSSFGDLSSQVNYELLTRLPIEIPRRVVD